MTTDLSGISTGALVDELVKRDGVMEVPEHVDHCDLPAYFFGVSQHVRIIVVQGDGE